MGQKLLQTEKNNQLALTKCFPVTLQSGTEYVLLQYRLNLCAVSQTEQTSNQVICGAKDATEKVRKIHLTSIAHEKFNKKCRVMGIIKYNKSNYYFLRIYRGLQNHQLCQNGNDSKDLSCQNMFSRHHVNPSPPQKKQNSSPIMSLVSPILGSQHKKIIKNSKSLH